AGCQGEEHQTRKLLASRCPLALFAIALQSRPPALQGAGMSNANRPSLLSAMVLGLFTLGLSGCTTGPQLSQPAAPAVGPAGPPAFPPPGIVGRWGFAGLPQEENRARTAANGRSQ